MLSPAQKVDTSDESYLIKALNENYAIIEFTPEGNILNANELFYQAMGYNEKEVVGKHHSIFCDSEYAESLEYRQFWKDLSQGKPQYGEFKRFTKDGTTIWLGASYTPIFDEQTKKVVRVVKFAQDKTESILKAQEDKGQIQAISKSRAVIEFNLDGTIIHANQNFLAATGYVLDEIVGKHHRIFCEPEYASSTEYIQFWEKLKKGVFDSGEYKRITKSGEDLWIQASYNPILDPDGKPFKVVKFATDVTEEKKRTSNYESIIEAIDKSQAVIEFNLDGTIITANQNFLQTTGYTLEEIQGKHHKIFCSPEYVNSPDYQQFWKKLNDGTFDSGEYQRWTKSGQPVWINASYNPVLDLDGNVYKVIKFATDLTQEKLNYQNLVDSFDKAASELMTASLDLSSTAEQLNLNAESTLEKSQEVTKAMEEVNQGVMTVGTSTEEMSSSIQEIAGSAIQASKKSQEAKSKSDEANTAMTQLNESSDKIGAVIKIISSIAQQTNLLALNATIEAARAGEAGKGFAVVANEVKELAKQTSQATEQISGQIGDVQGATKGSVEVISQIGALIDSLSDIASSTAGAVEEQSATTNEVSRVLSESSKNLESVLAAVSEVNRAAQESSHGANNTLKASQALKELSQNLKVLVENAR